MGLQLCCGYLEYLLLLGFLHPFFPSFVSVPVISGFGSFSPFAYPGSFAIIGRCLHHEVVELDSWSMRRTRGCWYLGPGISVDHTDEFGLAPV